MKQDEVDEMVSVVGTQTAVCHMPGFVENLIQLLKSQTLMYNSCLFSYNPLTFSGHSSLYNKTVVERLQKDIPIPGNDSLLVPFDNWSRIRERHRNLTTLTRENMSEASVSAIIAASRQVCLTYLIFPHLNAVFVIMIVVTKQPDMFFILFSLLSGCRKVDIQKRCAEAGLVDVITRFIKSTAWDSPPSADDVCCLCFIVSSSTFDVCVCFRINTLPTWRLRSGSSFCDFLSTFVTEEVLTRTL